MSRIPPFAVEQWMNEYETKAKFNIAETCCASISVDELVALSEDSTAQASKILDSSLVQNYGEIQGDSELRSNLSRLYSSKTATPLSPDNILITPGAIAANHLVLYALTGPGDHVICHYPTYQQLYTVPATLGAEVDLWRSDPDNAWLPDLDALKAMVKDNTKLIILNNPQNPTGAILPRALLEDLVAFAATKSIPVLADEVYRPLFHSISPISPTFPPSLLSLPAGADAGIIVTGSLSKAYSLAGLRVGWIASRSAALVARCAAARDYTTISVSRLDQRVAAFALSPVTVHRLLARNLALARENLALLEKWVERHDDCCGWVRPVAGTTAFVRFHVRDEKERPIDAAAFCRAVMEATGVMLLPGDVGFGEEWKGYVRFGFVNKTEILKDALEELKKFMRKDYDDIPTY